MIVANTLSPGEKNTHRYNYFYHLATAQHTREVGHEIRTLLASKENKQDNDLEVLFFLTFADMLRSAKQCANQPAVLFLAGPVVTCNDGIIFIFNFHVRKIMVSTERKRKGDKTEDERDRG